MTIIYILKNALKNKFPSAFPNNVLPQKLRAYAFVLVGHHFQRHRDYKKAPAIAEANKVIQLLRFISIIPLNWIEYRYLL